MRGQIVLSFAVVAIIIACGGEKTTEPPRQNTPPAALRLVVPDTVTRGVAFPLTVSALDGQGQINSAWTGTISLNASAGTISPSTLSVTGGTVTVQATIGQYAGPVSITTSVGTASDSKSAMVLSGQPAARLEVHPATFLLGGAGSSQSLSVRLFDAAGQPTTGAVTWESDNTGVVSVSSAGLASGVSLGSAQVTARSGSVVSQPALALVATPPNGAVLVADHQIAGSYSAVDTTAPYGPGWRYRVRLTGVAPQVGQLLLASGEKALGGRVVALQVSGATSEVTMELVPLATLLPNLRINETIPLRWEPPASARMLPQAPWAAIAESPFSLGPFSCKASLTQPNTNPFTMASVAYDITPTFVVDIQQTETRNRVVLRGGLTGTLTVKPTLTAAINGSAVCRVQVGEIPIPIGGPVAFFLAATVPVGLGFEVSGGVTLATMGLDLAVSAGSTISLGWDNHPGWTTIFDITGSASGSVKPNLPSPASDFRVAAGVSGFVWAALELGPPEYFPGAAGLRFKPLEAKAGLKQDFNLSTEDVQANDAAYASSFSLRPFFSGGTTSDLQQVLSLLNVSLPPLTYSAHGSALAESPAGSFQIVPSQVKAATAAFPGDTATFIVDLARTSYLTQYAVESVRLFRRSPANGSLVPAPGPCASITATPGQSLFTCKTDLPVSMAGEQTFYAFVKPILGTALPILLEVASDAKGTVKVDTTRVVYETAFDGIIDTVWSHRTGEIAPGGQRYLGPFTNEAVKLSLANLPSHGKVKIEFDLYIVRSWDGSNTTKPGNGPDIVTVTLGNNTLLHATFSNVNGVDDHRQSYPDPYPGPLHDAATGAFSKNTLGYTGGSDHHNKDSIYRLSFEVDHAASSIVFQVKGTNLSAYPDEWWGLDNIKVTVR